MSGEPRRSSRPRKPKSQSDDEGAEPTGREDSHSGDSAEENNEKTPSKKRGRPKTKDSSTPTTPTPTSPAPTPTSAPKRRKGLPSDSELVTLIRHLFASSSTKPSEAAVRAELNVQFGDDWLERKEFVMDTYLSFQ
eukprot:TRINITY_DN8234_c0_g1_i1.p1 TRINITY_DN8234_c0_g1~~TRINITY_DN8234_c0_g1_i1.p1  ORF type:complete len:136 (-),score=25.55 TRINITY_DN8234_c0_g1_i1:11-418(-)